MTVAMRCEQLRNHSTGAVTERLAVAAAIAPWPAAQGPAPVAVPALPAAPPFSPPSSRPFIECAQQAAFAAQFVQAQAQTQASQLQSSPPPAPLYPYLMPMWPERPPAPPVGFLITHVTNWSEK